MEVPADHLGFLRRRPFVFGCNVDVFPAAERTALAEFGNWMTALVSGVIQPFTEAQRRFLRVARGEADAESVYERAWVRLQGRREFEQEQQIPPPSLPSEEEYDIPDWDLDRWW